MVEESEEGTHPKEFEEKLRKEREFLLEEKMAQEGRSLQRKKEERKNKMRDWFVVLAVVIFLIFLSFFFFY